MPSILDAARTYVPIDQQPAPPPPGDLHAAIEAALPDDPLVQYSAAKRREAAAMAGQDLATEHEKRIGQVIDPEARKAIVDSKMRQSGVPTPEDDLRIRDIRHAEQSGANASVLESIGFGVQGFRSAMGGAVRTVVPQSAEDLQRVAQEEELAAVRHAALPPVQRAASGITETALNIAPMMIPGVNVARTASLGARIGSAVVRGGLTAGTMVAPQQENLMRNTDLGAGEAALRAGGSGALMEATTGLVRMPGALPGANLTRNLGPTAGRLAYPAQEIGRAGTEGLAQGLVMQEGERAMDQAAGQPVPERGTDSPLAFGMTNAVMRAAHMTTNAATRQGGRGKAAEAINAIRSTKPADPALQAEWNRTRPEVAAREAEQAALLNMDPAKAQEFDQNVVRARQTLADTSPLIMGRPDEGLSADVTPVDPEAANQAAYEQMAAERKAREDAAEQAARDKVNAKAAAKLDILRMQEEGEPEVAAAETAAQQAQGAQRADEFNRQQIARDIEYSPLDTGGVEPPVRERQPEDATVPPADVQAAKVSDIARERGARGREVQSANRRQRAIAEDPRVLAAEEAYANDPSRRNMINRVQAIKQAAAEYDNQRAVDAPTPVAEPARPRAEDALESVEPTPELGPGEVTAERPEVPPPYGRTPEMIASEAAARRQSDLDMQEAEAAPEAAPPTATTKPQAGSKKSAFEGLTVRGTPDALPTQGKSGRNADAVGGEGLQNRGGSRSGDAEGQRQESAVATAQEGQGQDAGGSPRPSNEGRGDQVPQSEVAPGTEHLDSLSRPAAAEQAPSIPATPALERTKQVLESGTKRIKGHIAAQVAQRIGAVVQKFRNATGLFQGNKLKAMPNMARATLRTMTPEQRSKVSEYHDMFGGSGSAGLLHIVSTGLKPKVVRINELDPQRSLKIQKVQTEGAAWVQRMLQGDAGAALRKVVQSGDATSGGAIRPALRKEAANIADPEAKAALRLFEDAAQRAKYEPEQAYKNIVEDALSYARDSKKLADEVRAGGTEIKYTSEDSYGAEIPKGDHVMVFMDPPYFNTSGYTGGVVGNDIYTKSVDMFKQRQDAGNHVMYTDEWWPGRSANNKLKNAGEFHPASGKLEEAVKTADTVDLHTVDGRTETLMTSNGSKTREVKPAEAKPVEASKVETKPVVESGKPVDSTQKAEAAHPPEVQQRLTAIRNALQGRQAVLTAKSQEHAPIGLHDMDVRFAKDGSYEVFDPKSGETIARVVYATAPKARDMQSWWNSISQHGDVSGLFRKAKGRGVAPKTFDEFRNLPTDVRNAMVKHSQTAESYRVGSDEVTIHVPKDGPLPANVETYAINHGLDHFVVTRKLEQADRDALLQGIKDDKRIKVTGPISADPSKGHEFVNFLEAVRKLNELTPTAARIEGQRLSEAARLQRSPVLRALRKIKEWISSIARSLGIATKEAAKVSESGATLALKRMRAGDFAKTKPAEVKDAPEAYSTRERDEGEDEGSRLPYHERGTRGLEDSALPILDRIYRRSEETREENRTTKDKERAAAEEYVQTAHDGDYLKALNEITERGASSLRDQEILELAANKFSSEARLGGREIGHQIRALLERTALRRTAGQVLAIGKETAPGTGEERLTHARQLVLSGTTAQVEAYQNVNDAIAKAVRHGVLTPDAKAKFAARKREIEEAVEKHKTNFDRRLRRLYGFELFKDDIKVLMDDPIAYAAVSDILAHEARKADFTENAVSLYRAGLLSNPLMTQTQQIYSNTAQLLYRTGIQRFFTNWLGHGMPLTEAWNRNHQLSLMFSGHAWSRAMSNLTASFKAGENVGVRETSGAHLGRGEFAHSEVSPTIRALEDYALGAPDRIMAAIDGAAQDMAQLSHEADLMYARTLEIGGTKTEAKKHAKQVLSGEIQAPDDIKLEAMLRSLKVTGQENAVRRPGLTAEGWKGIDSARVIAEAQRVASLMDHALTWNKVDKETGEVTPYRIPLGAMAGLIFIRTPMTLARQSASLFPPTQAALMGRRALAGRYRTSDGADLRAEDIGHLASGVALTAMLGAAIKAGLISATGTEQDPNRKKLLNEGKLSGAPPEKTIRFALGSLGFDLPFGRAEPFATPAAAIINVVNDVMNGKYMEATPDAAAAFLRMGEGLSMFRAINDFRDMFGGSKYDKAVTWKDTSVRYMLDRIASVHPALWREIWRDARDEQDRPIYADQDVVKNNTTFSEESYKAMIDYILKRSGIRESESHHDFEGETVQASVDTPGLRTMVEGGLGRSTKAKPSEIADAIDEYNTKLGSIYDDKGNPITLHIPSTNRTAVVSKQSVRWTDEQFSRFEEAVGKRMKTALAGLPGMLRTLPATANSAKIAQKLISKAHRDAVKSMGPSILHTTVDVKDSEPAPTN